ncbi:TolC family protein [Myxococcus sp. K38C18041901]|uniref:TolC family protein n=1 Tax=Myxococcus guangdongensis TaxID=2906760 RepID=UPI0020A72B4D|nr:TolC family protein [Myxococcus guangdongensis]MCP3063180.1 TolC family protein [Myxococcus guangdongensis]
MRALSWMVVLGWGLAAGAARASTEAPGVTAEARVLTLDEAESTARERQPRLRSAQAGTDAARARTDQSRAGLFPQVSGSAGYDVGRNLTTEVPGGRGVSKRFSAGVSANQLLYDFGRTSGRLTAARQSAQAQESSQAQTLEDVLLDVRAVYFDTLTQFALLDVAQETLDTESRRLQQVQAAVEVGSRPEIDLLQQRTARANAQVQLIRARNGYASAKARLNQAMGVEGSTDYVVRDVAVAPLEGEEAATEVLVERALSVRADVAAGELQVRAQETQVGVARGGYWPSLGATAGVQDLGDSPVDADVSVSGGLNLSWNLWDSGRTRAEVRERRALVRDARAQQDALRQQVRLEVEQTRLAVTAAREALSAAEEALLNARERLRLAEGRYAAGVGNIIELGDAQVAYTSAAAQRVQANYELATARAELARALGTRPTLVAWRSSEEPGVSPRLLAVNGWRCARQEQARVAGS